MADILDLELPEDVYQRKRKRQAICRKVEMILEYFKENSVCGMQSYEFLKDDYTGGKDGIVRVRVGFFPSDFSDEYE